MALKFFCTKIMQNQQAININNAIINTIQTLYVRILIDYYRYI